MKGRRLFPDQERIDAVAAEWVGRRDLGLSKAEEAELEQWAAADTRHSEALARFEATWSSLGRPRRTGTAPSLARELSRLRNRRRQTGTVAAVLLLLGMVWSIQHWPGFDPSSHPLPMIVLMPERRTLPDGSVVEFPTGTDFSVEFTEDVRQVKLVGGEVHFQVMKDPTRPFRVTAAGIGVNAVGTAFAVHLSSGAVEILVTEGRVAVDQSVPTEEAGKAMPKNLATIDAGNRIVMETPGVAGENPSPTILPVPAGEMSERLAWRAPRVEFSGTPLTEVVDFLNRHNSVKFLIVDPALGSTALSGLFRIGDTDAFARMLEKGFGVSVERRGQQILLKKAPQT